MEGNEYIKSVCGDLNIIPYDYEVIQGGSKFNENSGDEEHSPWYYYVLPAETLDSFNSDDYEVEILDEMFISDENLAFLLNTDLEQEDVLEQYNTNSARLLWFNWKSAIPSGRVLVYDEVEKNYRPVPNAKVTVTQWCYTHSAYTDKNGYYNLGVKYTTLLQNNALVTVWFENENEEIMPAWALSASFYTQGHISVGNLKGNDIKLKNNTYAQKYGNILRAAELYRGYANDYGVTKPDKLKIWAALDGNTGVTLMGKDVIGPSAVFMSAYKGLCSGGPMAAAISGAVASVICGYIPDLVIGCKRYPRDYGDDITSTEVIFKITFHEMAHASHFNGLGNGAANYWANEYIDMLFGWLEVLLNKKNPLTNCYNDGKSERVCFIESWGYFFGDYLMAKHYKGKTIIQYNYLLSGILPSEYNYFYNQAYYSMTTAGYSIKDIFNIYKKHDVYSARSFVDEFAKSNHLNSTQKNELEVLLKSKGAKF